MLLKYFTLDEIGEMEITDFEDWKAVAKAKELNNQLELINIMPFAHPISKKDISKRQSKFDAIQNEKFMLLGHNPFKADEKMIKKSKEFLKKQKIIRLKKK